MKIFQNTETEHNLTDFHVLLQTAKNLCCFAGIADIIIDWRLQ